MKEVHVIVSPTGGAGRAAAAAAATRSAIEADGLVAVDISSGSAREAVQEARRAVRSGARRMVAVGGDGTVHLTLQGVAGTETVLGIVPVGTGNDFARTFGLPGLTVEQAAIRALGPARRVDAIGADGGRWAASHVTGGFSADVNARAQRLRFPKGPSRYTVATLLTAPKLRHRRLVLTVDDRRLELSSAFFTVSNTPTFGGGMAVCPDADPCDGLLDVAAVGPLAKATLLRLLPKVFDGAHVSHPDVHMMRGRAVTVEGEPMDLIADGESFGSTPITLRSVPGAVRLAADGPSQIY